MEATKDEDKAPPRLTYPELYALLHAADAGSMDKLVAEYEAVRAEIKEHGRLSEEESSEDDDGPSTPSRPSSGSFSRRNNDKLKRSISQISDDRPYPRGRIPAGSGRQPKLKKSKLMQKITGRKNARPVPMPGM